MFFVSKGRRFNVYSTKNKKNISEGRLLKLLTTVLTVKRRHYLSYITSVLECDEIRDFNTTADDTLNMFFSFQR